MPARVPRWFAYPPAPTMNNTHANIAPEGDMNDYPSNMKRNFSFRDMRACTALGVALALISAMCPAGCDSNDVSPSPMCDPVCRDGFACSHGSCVSACNPGCQSTEVCVSSGASFTCSRLTDAAVLSDATVPDDTRSLPGDAVAPPIDAPLAADAVAPPTDGAPPDTVAADIPPPPTDVMTPPTDTGAMPSADPGPVIPPPPPPADAGTCPMGTTCSGACVDTATDPANCGACGARCGAGAVCLRGRCELTCGATLTVCGGICTDLRADDANCGACGRRCTIGQRCVAGLCQVTCLAGRTACAGSCVDPATDAANCGGCGVACRTGELCQSGTCALATARVTVSWEFPGLWERGSGEAWLPTYVTHLFGSVPPVAHPFEMNLACATAVSAETSAVRLDLQVRVPGFGADRMQSTTLVPGVRQRVCLNPGWDLARLAALRSFTTGGVEVYARLADGREVGRAMRTFAALASNGIVWDEIHDGLGNPIWWEDGGRLSTVYVTPNDPTVLTLRRAAEARSIFPGGFGASPYTRSEYARTRTVAVGGQSWERFVLEAGEPLAFVLQSVAGGIDANLNVYLFTESQYQAWNSGTGTTATMAWRNLRTGATGNYTAPTANWYRMVLFNTRDNFVSRDVRYVRSNTRFDVAYDAERSIFEELRARGMFYVNIMSSYYEGVQLIRRPRESLEMRAANCIDGTFLFASVLENIGMSPYVVLLPGHAIVGVATSTARLSYWPIETTMVGGSSSAFEALLSASDQIFRAGTAATPIDVTSARADGIRPLPL